MMEGKAQPMEGKEGRVKQETWEKGRNGARVELQGERGTN